MGDYGIITGDTRPMVSVMVEIEWDGGIMKKAILVVSKDGWEFQARMGYGEV